MTEPTPISAKATELQQRITRLTAQLAETEENDPEGRRAIVEQIEILKAELAGEMPPGTDQLPPP